MDWIESHKAILWHRKTGRLMRALSISRIEAVGYLHAFWWWCTDNAPEGDLSNIDVEDIADGALWEGDPRVFFDGLRFAGWIDTTEGVPTVHDWMEHMGKLIERRKADAERKRNARLKLSDSPSAGHPPDIHRTADVPYPTVPYPTEPLTKEREGTKERREARAKEQTPTPILRAVPKPKATATTLQEDFVITPDMRAWAAQNVPTVDVESATSAWLDYCRAKQPKYSDWLAAWRNGMRKAAEWQGQGSGGTRNGANQGRRLSKGERNNAFWQQYQLEREGIRNQGADRNIVPGASPPDTGRY